MKNPLHYQLSEYDCGPTAMLDAISYLFDREEILPRNFASSHDVSEQLAQWLW